MSEKVSKKEVEKHLIQIVGMEGGGGGWGSSCDSAGCGPQDCSPEAEGCTPQQTTKTTEDQAKEVASELKKKFGEKIEVEYVDVYAPSNIATVQNVMMLVMSGEAALPVTLINGEPKIGGAVSVPMIAEELESLGIEPKKSSR